MDTKQQELLSEARIPLRYREKFKADVPFNEFGPWRDVGMDVYSKFGRGGLFALIGKSGVGKSQIAAILIYSAIKNNRWQCRYLTARDFFLLIKATFHKDSPDTEEMVISDLCKPILLVIDEYEKRGQTEWEDGLLEHLINKRYGMMRETVLVSNSNRQAFELALGPANLSRMNETGGIFVCEWPSFREGRA